MKKKISLWLARASLGDQDGVVDVNRHAFAVSADHNFSGVVRM